MLHRLMTRRRFKMPANVIGADLIWWRESAALHTLITVLPPDLAGEQSEPLALTFVLFDRDGLARARFERSIEGAPISLDSRALRSSLESEPGADAELDLETVDGGMLGVFASTTPGTGPDIKNRFERLNCLVDWYSNDGDLISIRNDQAIVGGERAIEFTEIVFRETHDEHSHLVLLNGSERQEAGSIVLEAKNHRGDSRQAIYHPAMEPFTVHPLALGELFNTLVDFCDGRHATIAGVFNGQGLFTHPYVLSEGPRQSGYSGGHRCAVEALPAPRYVTLGRGRVAPMPVLHHADIHTSVNIFNAHGDIEEDFWVDARVYDESGALIAEHERWLLAGRHQLARANVAELLPDPERFLTGSIVLHYARCGAPRYPGTLQALMEYRSHGATARVAARAGEWNGPERRATPGSPRRHAYRVVHGDMLTTHLAVINGGLTAEYDEHADVVITLRNARDESRRWTGTLAPQGTLYTSIEALFPDIEAFLDTDGAGIVTVESRHDLAAVQFGQHRHSNAMSAAHFVPLVPV